MVTEMFVKSAYWPPWDAVSVVLWILLIVGFVDAGTDIVRIFVGFG